MDHTSDKQANENTFVILSSGTVGSISDHLGNDLPCGASEEVGSLDRLITSSDSVLTAYQSANYGSGQSENRPRACGNPGNFTMESMDNGAMGADFPFSMDRGVIPGSAVASESTFQRNEIISPGMECGVIPGSVLPLNKTNRTRAIVQPSMSREIIPGNVRTSSNTVHKNSLLPKECNFIPANVVTPNNSIPPYEIVSPVMGNRVIPGSVDIAPNSFKESGINQRDDTMQNNAFRENKSLSRGNKIISGSLRTQYNDISTHRTAVNFNTSKKSLRNPPGGQILRSQYAKKQRLDSIKKSHDMSHDALHDDMEEGGWFEDDDDSNQQSDIEEDDDDDGDEDSASILELDDDEDEDSPHQGSNIDDHDDKDKGLDVPSIPESFCYKFSSSSSLGYKEIIGVMATKEWVGAGKRIGSVTGVLMGDEEGCVSPSSWELCTKGSVLLYVNGDSDWLTHVQCAQRKEELNVEAVQRYGEIYYQTTKVIAPGEELKVFYSEEYAKCIGFDTRLECLKFDQGTQMFSCIHCELHYNNPKLLLRHMKFSHQSTSSDLRPVLTWESRGTTLQTLLNDMGKKFKGHSNKTAKQNSVAAIREGLLSDLGRLGNAGKPHQTLNYSAAPERICFEVPPIESNETHVCTFCNKTFPTEGRLRAHWAFHILPTSDAKQPRENLTDVHAVNHQSSSQSNFDLFNLKEPTEFEAQKFFQCEVCHWTYRSRRAVHAHEQKEHPEFRARKFFCCFCPVGFRKESELRDHEKEHATEFEKRGAVEDFNEMVHSSKDNKGRVRDHKTQHDFEAKQDDYAVHKANPKPTERGREKRYSIDTEQTIGLERGHERGRIVDIIQGKSLEREQKRSHSEDIDQEINIREYDEKGGVEHERTHGTKHRNLGARSMTKRKSDGESEEEWRVSMEREEDSDSAELFEKDQSCDPSMESVNEMSDETDYSTGDSEASGFEEVHQDFAKHRRVGKRRGESTLGATNRRKMNKPTRVVDKFGIVVDKENGDTCVKDMLGKKPNYFQDPALTFKCRYCPKRYAKQSGVRDHEKEVHEDSGKYKCEHCPAQFVNNSRFLIHQQKHNMTDKLFKCSECPRSFASETALKNHGDEHNGLKPYKCDICGKGFARQPLVQAHIRRVHTVVELKHPCSLCHKRFANRWDLTKHERRHAGYRPFKCEVCEKAFTSKYSLEIHVRGVHEKLKPYECEVCGKTFTTTQHRNTHVLMHKRKGEKV